MGRLFANSQKPRSCRAIALLMIIAIDYDDTWSADPDLWAEFALSASKRGHCILIATNRRSGLQELGWPVVYCSASFTKRQATRSAGYEVDVWIDDNPKVIEGRRQRRSSIF